VTRAQRWYTWIGVGLGVFVADQLTKEWALNALTVGAPRHVFWTLHWNLVFNSGMAFSKGRGLGPLIAVIVPVVVGLIVRSLHTSKRLISAVIIGLIVGGAAGNLSDRMFRVGDGFLGGHVVDFIDLRWWPVWNIADAAVVIGMVLLAIEWSRHKPVAS
jgi:signal peptidase II